VNGATHFSLGSTSLSPSSPLLSFPSPSLEEIKRKLQFSPGSESFSLLRPSAETRFLLFTLQPPFPS